MFARLRVVSRATGAIVLCSAATATIVLGPSPAYSAGQRPQVIAAMTCDLIDLEVPGSVTDAQAVAVPGTSRRPYSIRGQYCRPATGPAPEVVLLALHGITYNHAYWNPDFRNQQYSFARAMTRAGYGTFAIDRLGYGDSSHPASALVTLDSQAAVAHEIVGQLRAGKVAQTAFRRVVLVGHSYGSGIVWRETALFNDADAVIATGWGSTIQTSPLARLFTGFYPAAADPKFSAKNYDPGYFTPLPGSRNQDFLYDLSNADPAMISYDDRELRDTVAGGEAFTFYNRYGAIPLGAGAEVPLPSQAKAIRIPSFLVNGEHDLFFCGSDETHCVSSQALQRAEAPYFTDQACFRAAVVPDAGHMLNLQRNAQFTYETILSWLEQSIGTDGWRLDHYKSRCAAFSGANVPSGSGFGPFGGQRR